MSEKTNLPEEGGTLTYNSTATKIGTPHISHHSSEMSLHDKEHQDVEQGPQDKPAGPGNRKFQERTRQHWYQFWRFKNAPPPPPLSMDDAPEIPLAHTNWYSDWSYEWITSLLFLGYRRPIEAEDLWKLDGPRQAETLSERLIEEWEMRVAKVEEYNRKLASGETPITARRRRQWASEARKEAKEDIGGVASVEERIAAKEAVFRGPPREKPDASAAAAGAKEAPPKNREEAIANKVRSGYKEPSLVASMWQLFKYNIYVAYFAKLIADTSYLVVALLIEYMLDAVSERKIGLCFGYTVVMFVILVLSNFLSNRFFYESTYVGVFARAALISAIFKRALKMQGRDRSTGKLVNHLSTDVSRIDFGAGWWLLAFTAPVEIIVCLVILLSKFGYQSFSGFALIVVVVPLEMYCMTFLFKLRSKSMTWTDKRARRTQEVLSGMRIVKLFSYESSFLKLIRKLRTRELYYIFQLNVMRAAIMAVAISLPVMASVLAIITYVGTHRGDDFHFSKIYMAVTLFQLLRLPLMFLPFGLSVIADGANSFSRLRTVFSAEQHNETIHTNESAEYALTMVNTRFQWDNVEEDPTLKQTGKEKIKKQKQRRMWNFLRKNKNGEKRRKMFARKRESHHELGPLAEPAPVGVPSPAQEEVDNTEETFEMSIPDLKIKRGELCAIIGPVGSGKSSLLLGALGEMRRLSGDVTWSSPRIAYCSQGAWIMNATVRDNILFGEPFDEARYWECVKRAELVADFEMLQGGDLTEIGERGVTLSGGQKQRVNIARALYYNADIVCLDDPLSAVDAHVGKALFFNAICQLRKEGKTVLLVTHAIHFLPHVDRIITMADGAIEEIGTYNDLMRNRSNFHQTMIKYGQFEGSREGEEDAEELAAEVEDAMKVKTDVDYSRLSKPGGQNTEAEERNTGAVDGHVYSSYLKAGKWILFVPMALVAASAMQASTNFSTYWINYWGSDYFGKPLGFYIGIYILLGCTQFIFNFILDVLLGIMTVFAAKTLHDQALRRVIYAPMSWFDTTPLGRVMNRFGKDVDVLDNQLSNLVRQIMSTIMSIIGATVITTYVTYYFIIAVAAVFIFAGIVGQFYRNSAREFKRIDAVLRSVLYSHFAESLSGLTTIRTYQKSQLFLEDNYKRVDLQNRAYLLTIVNQRWLGLRLDIAGSFLVLILGIIVSARLTQVTGATPEELALNLRAYSSKNGVAFSSIVVIAQTLGFLTRQLTEIENEMNSAERLIHYGETLPQEAEQSVALHTPPEEWPQHGSVQLNDVWLRYRPNLPNVLKGVSMNVEGGQKVGIVGRTGAGKSSIMTVLLRLSELTGGSVIIDGVDVSKIGLEDLRRRIAILPQEPLLFSGTLRSNLDPFKRYDDSRLLDAMKRAYLTSVTIDEPLVEGQESKGEPTKALTRLTLDSIIDEEGANLSIGQRSLVSLARALVKDSRIILLDEATASVDLDTDAKIQTTIRNEFGDRTLLCIAHRLTTIIGYDRVVVMDDGRVAEYDTPLALFDRADGIFRGMCERSNISREDIINASM
ncbi:hypothetical protein MCUN1_000085 [Malassezia cuniculi]|uniref:Oligomycin resistance ATP-dependent permease YOR1 n=1 Tax=Malassezia cuniculi TaxID=948313 RepID=A0AAF0EQP5_9BASI|nr:hypothetical protein MCUN1_000085 [Malassezia cuniculi]